MSHSLSLLKPNAISIVLMTDTKRSIGSTAFVNRKFTAFAEGACSRKAAFGLDELENCRFHWLYHVDSLEWHFCFQRRAIRPLSLAREVPAPC
jgi:hypothetical protein